MKVCSVPGCPGFRVRNRTRCADHERAANQGRTKPYTTAGHLTFRQAVLTRDPQCTWPGCTQPATDADHYPLDRRQLIDAGMDPNDPAHGRGLCHPHHSKHTAQAQPGGWNAAR